MDRSKYQGRQFAFLLLAICLPAGLLYLRLVLEVVASHGRLSRATVPWLEVGSAFVLFLFLCVQLVCAAYLQKLLKLPRNKIMKALQFTGVFLMGLFFSITGAVMLEAFGINVLVRAGLIR